MPAALAASERRVDARELDADEVAGGERATAGLEVPEHLVPPLSGRVARGAVDRDEDAAHRAAGLDPQVLDAVADGAGGFTTRGRSARDTSAATTAGIL
jgi:hypothetical protein